MKLPAFDLSKASWDRYKAFYMGHPYSGRYVAPPFVQFDTGELICTRGSFKPDERKRYLDLDIEVTGTGDVWGRYDTKQIFKTPEGEPIPRAWLNRKGMQTLLLDHETRRAVRLNYRREDRLLPIPVRLRPHATAYFAGPGEPPVGKGVRVGRPKAFSKAEKDHIRGIVCACKAWFALSEVAKGQIWISPQLGSHLLTKTFNDLTKDERCSLAQLPPKPEYDTTEYAYLTF